MICYSKYFSNNNLVEVNKNISCYVMKTKLQTVPQHLISQFGKQKQGQHLKTRLEIGPVTTDLTTTVIHSSKSLINYVNPDH